MRSVHPPAGALALLLAIAACHRDAPTAASPPIEVAEPTPIAAPPEQIAPYVAILNDMSNRLVPALLDQEVATGLGAQLGALRSAMLSNDGKAARASWMSAATILADYRASLEAGARDEANTVAIALNLAVADQLIGISQ